MSQRKWVMGCSAVLLALTLAGAAVAQPQQQGGYEQGLSARRTGPRATRIVLHCHFAGLFVRVVARPRGGPLGAENVREFGALLYFGSAETWRRRAARLTTMISETATYPLLESATDWFDRS